MELLNIALKDAVASVVIGNRNGVIKTKSLSPARELRTCPMCRSSHASTLKERAGVIPMSSTLFDLSGRAALVTGGSKGLGKAMARALAEAGASVAISSRHEDELKSAAADCPRICTPRLCRSRPT